MEIKSFIANSAIEAVSRIREELGPDAVVIEIRQIKPSGIGRLFQKPKIEVLAYKPEEEAKKEDDQLIEIKREISQIKSYIEEKITAVEKASSKNQEIARPISLVEGFSNSSESEFFIQKDWRLNFLQRLGIEPVYAKTIIEQISDTGSFDSTPNVVETQRLIEELKRYLKKNQSDELPEGVHIFIGSSGCGKSTFLCKLLSRLVLAESRQARVIQMDAVTANTSELPSLYSEILGVPYTRNYISDVGFDSGYVFIDIPGVDWQNRAAIDKLAQVVSEFKTPHIHLVLNLCYDTRLLIAQTRAFSVLDISDLVFTHIDEGALLGKIFNLVLGTNYTVGFLSGGQNIPGEIYTNSSEAISNLLFRQ